MLLLPKEQRNKAWEPSKKQHFFGNLAALLIKLIFPFFLYIHFKELAELMD
jgi:hypothetical protein